MVFYKLLTDWGRVTHICVNELTVIGSDNGLSPGRHQAIIWTNAGILLIGPLGTNFREILVKIQIFSIMKMCLKMSSAKWRPFCLGLNVLNCFNKMVAGQWFVFHVTPELQMYWTRVYHGWSYNSAIFNSVWPSDAIWRQRFWSTLLLVMGYCLTVLIHYLKPYWLTIKEIFWHWIQDNVYLNFQDNCLQFTY